MSVVVAQLGARMHYAVPRILEQAGLLERLYTDICARHGWPRWLRLIPPSLRPPAVQRLLGRDPVDIDTAQITAFTGFGWDYARRLARARTTDERNAIYLWSGREFGRRVVERGFGSANAVFTYNTAGLEIMRAASERGVKAVMEQTIAPRVVESKLLRDAASRFPQWEAPAVKDAMREDLCAREAAEWKAANLIVCGSEFVREGVVASGGEAAKCVVVPYGIEHKSAVRPIRKRQEGPLRVLTVGAVGLRKGSPFVLEAAQRLGHRATFRMVGAVQVLPEAERQLRAAIELTGVVPRATVGEHYDWADVFLLPSLCEGSATATYEAMFRGLPVICTPQTGSVVRDGIDGFIVPMADSNTIAEKLIQVYEQPELLAEMSARARENSTAHTLEKYGERLRAALRHHRII